MNTNAEYISYIISRIDFAIKDGFIKEDDIAYKVRSYYRKYNKLSDKPVKVLKRAWNDYDDYHNDDSINEEF